MGRPRKNSVLEENGNREFFAPDAAEMTPEAAEAAAQTDKTAQTEAAEKKEILYSQADVQAMVAKAVAEAMAKAGAVVPAAPQDMVTLIYLAEVSPESELNLPNYGTLRMGSYLEVPKKEFGNKFMSSLARKLLEKRHLIVMSGLSEDERRRWNCDYRPGEVLDERTFDKLLDYPLDKLCEIFEKLCPEHQRFVATRLITAKERNDNRVSIEKAKRLNELSKANDPEGMLKPVLEAYGKEIQG